MNRQITWLGQGVGQTRYQEYDPRTGAAIGAPMTQAEFDARGGLQRIPTVRAVLVPGPLFSLSSVCAQLKNSTNLAQQTYEELLKTRAAMVSAGVQPYAMTVINNAIAAALDSVNKLVAISTQLGCNNTVQLSQRLTVTR